MRGEQADGTAYAPEALAEKESAYACDGHVTRDGVGEC